MTIKALTNMYLLLHLMDRDQAGRVRLPYYLDEAADIDEETRRRCWRQACSWASYPSWRA